MSHKLRAFVEFDFDADLGMDLVEKEKAIQDFCESVCGEIGATYGMEIKFRRDRGTKAAAEEVAATNGKPAPAPAPAPTPKPVNNKAAIPAARSNRVQQEAAAAEPANGTHRKVLGRNKAK